MSEFQHHTVRRSGAQRRRYLSETAFGSCRMGLAVPLFVGATLAPTLVAAQSALPEIAIQGTATPKTSARTVTTPANESTAKPAADLAALLENTLGVTVSKMGAHGGDLSIRGQSQDRLAVVNDGAYTFGACPNRMDPPTSFVAESTVDMVEIQRGYQTVTNGPPAPGGSVIVERARPTFDTFGSTLSLSGGIESNGGLRQGGATVAMGAPEGYVRAFAEASRSETYKDGNDNDVRSGFENLGGGIDAGWNLDDKTQLTLSAERRETDNSLFAGAGMDAIYDATTTTRFQADRQLNESGPLTGVSLNIYASTVDHLMDNYTLRTPTGMKMATNSVSNTYGGSLSADFAFSGFSLTAGVDHRISMRDAITKTGMAASALDPTTIFAYTWPDMAIQDTGVYAEGEVPLSLWTTLTVGARLDRVEVDADKADATPQGGRPSARTLYSQYYGETDVTREEYNVSGLIRVEHDFGGLTGWATLSRAVRTADATERGMSRSSGASSWVGNPGLAPEKHHQLDLGLSSTGQTWAASGGVWVDEVSDYIARDTARGQDGVLQSNGATIYRNIDARLAGLEVEGQWKPVENWQVSAQMAYTHGDNTSDHIPLYQIAPLSGQVEARYSIGDWTMGPRLRWAMTQTRVDDNTDTGSGLDVDKTSGYGVVDLFAAWAPTETFEVRASVSNIMDQTYASHLNRSNGVDPTVVQVNEPGRSFSLSGRVSF